MSKKTAKYLVAVFCMTILIATSANAETATETHQESFAQDFEMKGLFASCEMYFQTEDWDIADAKLNLFYTATTLIRQEVSDFTVSVNGEPVYSQRIPLTVGERQQLIISIPKRVLKKGANQIRVESYIRTNDTDPCEEDISTGSWMVISKDSNISLTYHSLTVCRNVADVYGQLTSIEGLENNKSAVLLPSGATDNEMTAAALILSGISQNASLFYDNLLLKPVAAAGDMRGISYGAYVSEYDRLLPEIKELLTEEQREAAQKQGLIAFVKPEEDQNLLVITAKDAKNLQNASRLLGNREYMSQTKAVWRKVSESEDVTVVSDVQQSVLLTQTGAYVKGPFRQTAQFTVAMGANKTIAAGSEVDLRFRYAQNLDFDRSMVTVYAGDTPIGSKKLERDSCNADVLRVSIPDNLQITGNFTLNVTFDLEMKNFTCDIRQQDMPWAYVSGDSTVRVMTEEVPWLLFDYYPSPFIYEGKMNQVVVVLPVQESQNDLEAMRKILLTLGRYQTSNAGNIRVCRADSIGDLKQSNVISIGAYKRNPIAGQINNQLYFQFSPEGTTIRSNEKMKIEANYGASLGTAQVLYSPYSAEKYALMLVSGVTEEGMLHAADYIGNVPKNWQIYGDGFVADGELVFCYRFGTDNEKQNPIGSALTQQTDLILLLATGGGIVLLMLLSLAFLWRKHKK